MKKTVVFKDMSSVHFFDVADGRIVFAGTTETSLCEIYELNLKTNKLTKLTSLNEEALKGKYVAKPHRINYTSNGDKLHGWVLLPENFNAKKKYPAVLDVHGGPRTVYGTNFFHEMQVWAAKGFVVMFTNIRGSDGRDDEFADIRDQYGYVDFDQLMDFVDVVLEKYPNIDRKKLCETGGSYGGFMTNWIITHTDRFCCAASQRSISNWISMSYISDIGPYFGPDQCGGEGLFGEKNIEKLWEHSPLKYAASCKTPTLLIHSDEDFRCPLPEGMQMMQALAMRNVETRMCIFKGENHELSRSGKPLHRLRRLQEITDWFVNHTK
jgi:dipeptidyl aminopeptidase/acylaminoacyl peptidase